MGFCDITNAEVIAYTRQRRAEAKAARACEISERYGHETIFARSIEAAETSARVLRRRLTKSLMVAQRGRCYLCGSRMAKWCEVTQDHVWPKREGGTDAYNICLAHAGCNNAKGHALPTPCQTLYAEAIYLRVQIPDGML